MARVRSKADEVALEEMILRNLESHDPNIFMERRRVEFERMMAEGSFVGIRRVDWRGSHGKEDI